MATNSSGEFGGKLKGRKMKLKSLKTRDDMSIVEEDHYHTGASASVPFMWESEPGTPKANFRENGAFRSPLTPPPSYFSSPHSSASASATPLRLNYNNSKSFSSRTNFLNSVFRKLSVKATLQPLSPGSSSSSTSTSTSSSSSSTPTSSGRERGRGGSPKRLSFDSRDEEEDEEENVESPVSTLFFGRGGGASDKGCYPKLIKAFTRDYSK